MPANTPEEIPALLAAAMNAGDLDAFIDLHEHDATTIVPPDGHVASGTAEIRRALEPIFAHAPKLENEVVGKLEGDRLALIHARWALEETGPDGQGIDSRDAARSSPAASRTGAGRSCSRTRWAPNDGGDAVALLRSCPRPQHRVW